MGARASSMALSVDATGFVGLTNVLAEVHAYSVNFQLERASAEASASAALWWN